MGWWAWKLLGVVRLLAGSDRMSSGLTIPVHYYGCRSDAAVIDASVSEGAPTAQQTKTCRGLWVFDPEAKDDQTMSSQVVLSPLLILNSASVQKRLTAVKELSPSAAISESGAR